MHLHLRACAGLRGHLVEQSERSLMLQVRVGVPSRHVVSVSGCVSPVDSFMCGRPLAICLCVFSPAILPQQSYPSAPHLSLIILIPVARSLCVRLSLVTLPFFSVVVLCSGRGTSECQAPERSLTHFRRRASASADVAAYFAR